MTQDSDYKLRLATLQDAKAVQDIEYEATSKFQSIPELAHLASGDSATVSEAALADWMKNGRVWLAVHQDTAVGVIAALPMDTAIYVAEISVMNGHDGKGLGGKLLNAVFDWAREEAQSKGGDARVSLTCYADVPWNGPWYRRKGFAEVDTATIGPKHVAKMERDEHVRKLPQPWYRRCCMLRTENVACMS
ncbi:Putative GNAT domain, acyl-CoA N-acyltransferase [Septoria linicola]|uniref:GNAT domain, acyl-CoA N-acyltransferase n=1 Tax=Septoria linicola TaxID=215465 RepID=A0A9Q9EKG4_9PEZI|nr:putative GNAT domain, acyl-CoA N-acyltransferase [Septoria linicola]USW53234.1 Putative GNAT domain, acyl-CoA N-acyltransferase [Septoria linicola]